MIHSPLENFKIPSIQFEDTSVTKFVPHLVPPHVKKSAKKYANKTYLTNKKGNSTCDTRQSTWSSVTRFIPIGTCDMTQTCVTHTAFRPLTHQPYEL